jgi:hypothetical protein
MADTVTVIRLGESKPVPLPESLLIPDEAFICRSPTLKDRPILAQPTNER